MFSKSKQNYAVERLQALCLTKQDGFTAANDGSIIIHYHHLNGERATYEKEDTRKTQAIECPERYLNQKQYTVIRNTPENTIKFGKYHSPTGAKVLPFIPLEVRTAYQQNKVLPFLIFTEGELKAALLAKCGLSAISFKGISNYKLCPDTKEILRYSIERNNSFFIVLNYDSDATKKGDYKRLSGFFASAFYFCLEVATFCELEGLPIPPVKICMQNPNQQHKGIDDLIQSFGLPAIQNFCTFKTSQHFIFADVETQSPYKALSEFFDFNPQKYKALDNSLFVRGNWVDKNGNRLYLNDALHAAEIDAERLLGYILNIPTGYGKTSLIIQLAKQLAKQGNRIVLAVPILALITQVIEDATTAGIDVIAYNGEPNTRQLLIDRFKDNSENWPTLVVCTYASAGSLSRAMGTYTGCYNLVLDEHHTTTSATSPKYQAKQLNEVLDTANNYLSFTGLTGTPLYNIHPFTKKMRMFSVKVPYNFYNPNNPHRKQYGIPPTKTEILKAKDVLKAAAAAIRKSIDNGRLPVVLFNNKSERLADLLDLLQDVEGVRTFNSDTKDCPEWLELLETANLDSKAAAVICTSVLGVGVNINILRPADVIILGNHHPTTIRQFCSRFRKADVRLCIIQSNSEKNARWIDTEKELRNITKQAENVADLLNNCPCDSDILDIRVSIQNPYIRQIEGEFRPDYLAIQNAVFEAETNWFNSTPERLLRSLRQYGFENALKIDLPNVEEITHIEYTEERTLDEKQAATERRELKQIVKQADFKQVIEALSQSAFPHTTAVQAIEDKATSKNCLEFYSMFLELVGQLKDERKAIETLKATEGKQGRFKLLIIRIKVQRANFDSCEIGNAAAAVLRAFDHGRKYSASQLKDLFLDCLRTDSNVNLEPFEKAKRITGILKKLRMFFEVEDTGQGDDAEYLISNIPKI